MGFGAEISVAWDTISCGVASCAEGGLLSSGGLVAEAAPPEHLGKVAPSLGTCNPSPLTAASRART